LRFTFASLATTGRDVRFDLGRTDGYHRFCNKLWNATEYVLGHVAAGAEVVPTSRSTADRWIRSRLNATIVAVESAYASYRLDLAAQALYDFAWREYCDWYLELTKPLLSADETSAEAEAARATLAEVLGALLKLLHPLIPFITEELWLKLCARLDVESETIMRESLPQAADFPADPEAEAELSWLQGFVVGVRQIRGEMNISPARKLGVKLAGANASDLARVERQHAVLLKLGGIESVEIVAADAAVPGVATALLGEMRILVPLAGLIDVAKERERLGKQLAKVRSDLDKTRGKLANERFVGNAPDDVVAKERVRADELEVRGTQLKHQLGRLGELE
jgi:valyl-tRNA synthetase